MSKEKVPPVGELHDQAQALAQNRQTLTLATARGEAAWAAPVYYLFEPWRFYFFSDPQSRHIQEALASGRAAGTVHREGRGWQDIEGLQMDGCLVQVTGMRELARLLTAYFQKYPFTGDLLKNGLNVDWQVVDAPLFLRRFKVKLYAFQPSRVLYLNNSIRFGFRTEIPLPQQAGSVG